MIDTSASISFAVCKRLDVTPNSRSSFVAYVRLNFSRTAAFSANVFTTSIIPIT